MANRMSNRERIQRQAMEIAATEKEKEEKTTTKKTAKQNAALNALAQSVIPARTQAERIRRLHELAPGEFDRYGQPIPSITINMPITTMTVDSRLAQRSYLSTSRSTRSGTYS